MAELLSPKERLDQLNCNKERMRLKLENLKRKATILVKLAKQHSDAFPNSSDAVLKELQTYATEVSLLTTGTYIPIYMYIL